MNSKQKIIIYLAIVGTALIVYFTPRYKITHIDEKNFLITEQTSPLFKRSCGKVKFHTDKILIYSALWLLFNGLLFITFKSKHGCDNP